MSQDTRCWYYRAGWSCYRAGGNICYADTPTAINREHAILGADRCVAVNPSDTAPALVALGASMVIRSAGGERVVERRGLLHRPGHRHHADDGAAAGRAADGDPRCRPRGPGAEFYFEKVRDRHVWDFALVSVASAMVMSGGDDSRGLRVVGQRCRRAAAAAVRRSRRSCAASRATRRRPRLAGELAIDGAQPLRFNAYKMPLMRNLVQARRSAGSERDGLLPHLGPQPLGTADPHARVVGPAVGVAFRGCRVPSRARELHVALGAPQAGGRGNRRDGGRPAGFQLLLDASAAVGARIARTQELGVVRGDGRGGLRLNNVSTTSHVAPGDLIESAGIDGIYPRGVVIGHVSAVARGSDLFLEIRVTPAVAFSQLTDVLVLAPSPAAAPAPGRTGSAGP